MDILALDLPYLRANKARIRAERSVRFARDRAQATGDGWWTELAERLDRWLVWEFETSASYAPDRYRYL